jgi:hypothetical protein
MRVDVKITEIADLSKREVILIPIENNLECCVHSLCLKGIPAIGIVYRDGKRIIRRILGVYFYRENSNFVDQIVSAFSCILSLPWTNQEKENHFQRIHTFISAKMGLFLENLLKCQLMQNRIPSVGGKYFELLGRSEIESSFVEYYMMLAIDSLQLSSSNRDLSISFRVQSTRKVLTNTSEKVQYLLPSLLPVKVTVDEQDPTQINLDKVTEHRHQILCGNPAHNNMKFVKVVPLKPYKTINSVDEFEPENTSTSYGPGVVVPTSLLMNTNIEVLRSKTRDEKEKMESSFIDAINGVFILTKGLDKTLLFQQTETLCKEIISESTFTNTSSLKIDKTAPNKCGFISGRSILNPSVGGTTKPKLFRPIIPKRNITTSTSFVTELPSKSTHQENDNCSHILDQTIQTNAFLTWVEGPIAGKMIHILTWDEMLIELGYLKECSYQLIFNNDRRNESNKASSNTTPHPFILRVDTEEDKTREKRETDAANLRQAFGCLEQAPEVPRKKAKVDADVVEKKKQPIPVPSRTTTTTTTQDTGTTTSTQSPVSVFLSTSKQETPISVDVLAKAFDLKTLKAFCLEKHLPVSGTKVVLAERIVKWTSTS